MRTSLVIALAALSTGCLTELPIVEDPCASWDRTGLFKVTIERADVGKRTAEVWIPKGVGPRPMVTMLHGSGQHQEDIQGSTQWISNAGQEGAVIVFPNGVGAVWNAGQSQDGGTVRSDADDVGYLEELSRVVRNRSCGADHLVAGFSNGALMSHYWACRGEEFDAFVPAAGAMLHDPDSCNGPVAIRKYHGTKDNSVPFSGGTSRAGGIDYPSAEESIEVWQQINECTDAEPTVTTDGDTTCRAWECTVPTELCVVQGGGHVWPGGTNRKSGNHDATVDGYAWFLSAFE